MSGEEKTEQGMWEEIAETEEEQGGRRYSLFELGGV
jgi:hypothetical protein